MTARTILITGCSSGIGLSAAHRMREKGWRVFATTRQVSDAERLRTREGFADALTLDLEDEASVQAAAREALERSDGRIDVLFNNGAYGQIGAIEDISATALRRQLEVNVVGTHALTNALIPSMRQRGAGLIVQNSSVLGLASGPYRGAYSASKYALEAISDALRIELEGSGVNVVLIEPGPIRTRFIDHALRIFNETIDAQASPHAEAYKARLDAMERGGRTTFKCEPDAVVDKLVQAIEARRPKTRYYVTVPTYVAAYAKRFLPDRLFDRFARNN
ncbi:MAG: SDR family NAD(P)-dependent oxidoreductase [Pseudomonadota bacterium]